MYLTFGKTKPFQKYPDISLIIVFLLHLGQSSSVNSLSKLHIVNKYWTQVKALIFLVNYAFLCLRVNWSLSILELALLQGKKYNI